MSAEVFMVTYVCPLRCGFAVVPDLNNIIVHGAKEHNLKNICFGIPKGKLVALTGPSGSGKSSIATDILQKECVRQYLESMGMVTDHIEKARVDTIMGLSPSIGVTQRVTDTNPRSTVGTRSGILTILRNMFAVMGRQPCSGCGIYVKQPLQDKHKLTIVTVEDPLGSSSKKRTKSYFDCPQCGHQLETLCMAHFSSNTAAGACDRCKGIGEIIGVDISCLLNEEKTIKEGGVALWNEATATYYENVILAASKHYGFSFDPMVLIKDYTDEQKNVLLYGLTYPDFVKAYKHIETPKKVSEGKFEGIIPYVLNQYKKNPLKVSHDSKKFIMKEPCLECDGTGLSALGRISTIDGKTIVEVGKFELRKLLTWVHELDYSLSGDEKLMLAAFSESLRKRIANVVEVGLDYLTLERTLPSLSAGEAQRVKLANLLGSGLTGVLYVLDEPTTGLHPHDSAKLLKTLRMLQEAGNTVLIIEHDMDIVERVDYIIDMGLGGGSNGGEIVAIGTPADIKACVTSMTGKYLSQKPTLHAHVPSRAAGSIIIRGAREHNLKDIDVTIPIQQLVVLTGVSGSGKSTLLFDILGRAARTYLNRAQEIPGKHDAIDGLDYFKRIITVDQATIGNTTSFRSNIATYTKLFDAMRDLFASLPEAQARGFDAATFSFNASDERCATCNGSGVVAVDMTFMPDIETICPVCEGTRFSDELLAIRFQGYSIADILDMTVEQAIGLFKSQKRMFAILDVMKQVGLQHLKLGQSTSTLSGGEAQRIKLASELSKAQTGHTLYLLDEPTTGLHPHEVEKLLGILKTLVSRGNSVIVIEHNLDIIAQADTIIDFGPGGGASGGTIVATGTPQEIAGNNDSLTGRCLKVYFS